VRLYEVDFSTHKAARRADPQRYKATTGSQEERVVRWRGIAFVSLKLRTGEYPDEPPF
jgi:hypothetical protein